MTPAACVSALLAAMCLTPAAPQRAASAQSPPGGVWGLGHRGLAGRRRGRRRRSWRDCASPPSPGRFSRSPRWSPRLRLGWPRRTPACPCEGEATVKDQIIRCSHPRLRHPLRPAEALAVSCNVWFATVGARLSRARLDGVLAALGLPPTPVGRADAAGRHGTARLAVAADGLGRGALAPAAAAVGGPVVARRDGRRWSRGCAARRCTARPTRSANAGSTSWRRPAPQLSPPEARRRRGRRMAGRRANARALVLVAPGVAGKDAADLAAAVVASPPREAKPSAPPTARSAEPPAERSERAPSTRSAEPQTLRVGTAARRAAATPSRRTRSKTTSRECWPEKPRPKPACGARSARGGGADVCRRQSRATSARRLRPVHAHALPGAAYALRGRARCGGGNRRPGSARQRRAGVGVLHGVVRRTHRAPVGSLAWRRRSGATCPRSRIGPAGASLDGPPRSPCRISNERSSAAGYRGSQLRDLEVDGRSSSGRVARVHLDGMTPDAISGQDLRMVVGRALGWHLLKSTDFTVRRTGGGYRFDGKGFGHGVGMCVLGSVRRAEHGDSAREILRAYYPGLEIGRLRESPATPGPSAAVATVATGAREAPMAREAPEAPGLTLQLPAGAEPERGALTAFARRALADLSRATGQPAPARPSPRVSSVGRELPAGNGRAMVDRRAHQRRHGSICCRRPCFASAARSSPRCGTNWRTC